MPHGESKSLLRQPLPSVNECLVLFAFKLSQFLDEIISKNSTCFVGCFFIKRLYGFCNFTKVFEFTIWNMNVF